jgi:HEAT repeat protein
MNKRILIYSTVVLGILILIWLGNRYLSKTLPSNKHNAPLGRSAENTTSSIFTNQSPANEAIVRNCLEEIFAQLKKIGGGEESSAEEFLNDAVASGDKTRILKAFNEVIYNRKMSEVIPALRAFLNDPNPYVRFLAGQNLLVVGDNSGDAALLALVQSNDPIEGIGEDVRISAALALANYDQRDAVGAITNLYSKTQSVDLSEALSNLGIQLPGEGQFPFVASDLALTEYAKCDARFVPQIKELFLNTANSSLKASAAWALATMTNDQNAINYLIQQAQAGLNNANQVDDDTERNLIQYLGSVQTPAAKQTLESALSSSDSTIVQTAIVNLIFNQGGSDKAVQVIADQLNNPAQATLPWDFTLNVAAQLTSNSTIQSAGKTFAQLGGSEQWQLYTVERARWPVNNWIGNYVVKLNK